MAKPGRRLTGQRKAPRVNKGYGPARSGIGTASRRRPQGPPNAPGMSRTGQSRKRFRRR